MTLLVLAAGMGSRYGGLKQIDPVGPHGEIILDYAVFDALRAGFHRVIFVIRKDIEEPFRKAIGNRYGKAIEVDYVFQDLTDLPQGRVLPEGRVKPWGTAHAILVARHLLREPFVSINADDFYGFSSYQPLSVFLQEVDPLSCNFCMVGFTLRDTLSEHGAVARGLCRMNGNDHLVEITEHTHIWKMGSQAQSELKNGSRLALTGDELVSLNMWGFTPAVFSPLERLFDSFLQNLGDPLREEFLIPSAIFQLIHTQKATVRILPTDSSWIGVTYPEDKPVVQAAIRDLVQEKIYPSPLF